MPLAEILDEARALAAAQTARERARAESSGLTRAQWLVLREASRGGSVARIARRLGLTRQSVQRTADRLVDLALARYTANPNHARSPLVEPTEAGRARLLAVERSAASSPDQELSELFDPEELETALQVIRAVRDGLERR